jgi:hypothetical protein
MQWYGVRVILVVTWIGLIVDTGFATPGYVETGECEVRKIILTLFYIQLC